MPPQIIDTVNDDGSITRTTTITQQFTADAYAAIQSAKQTQIDKLTAELSAAQPNLILSQQKVASINTQPVQPAPQQV